MKFHITVRERREYEVEADSYDEAVRQFADRELEDKAILWEQHDALVRIEAEPSDSQYIVLYENPEPGSDGTFHDHHPATDEGISALLVHLASH